MTKKLLIIVSLLTVPMAAFALDLYVGPTAYYATAVQPQSVASISPSSLSLSDFAIGADARLYAGPLWIGGVGLLQPGTTALPTQMQLITDVGLGLKLLFLRAAVGVGPDFGLAFGGNSTQVANAGANIRVTGDVVLGKFSLGLSWISRVQLTAQSLSQALSNPYGSLGVALLFKL